MSGLIADSKTLIDRARVEAQVVENVEQNCVLCNSSLLSL